jgi:deoxyribodipyrimidine photo-lyase
MKNQPYGVHWFRRDLRIAGNSALKLNLLRNDGRVLGLFFFDSTFLSRSDFSYNRFGFFLATLKELQNEMKTLGGELLVLDSIPQKGFPEIFKKLKIKRGKSPDVITFNRDYEPFARNRDQRISEITQRDFGIEVVTSCDHLIFEPDDIKKPSGGQYQVFSPFYRNWLSRALKKNGQDRINSQAAGIKYLEARRKNKTVDPTFKIQWSDLFDDKLDYFIAQNSKKLTITLPRAGSLAAYETLLEFKRRIGKYTEKRDIPSENGTSHLSIFLKNGSLTTAQIFLAVGMNSKTLPFLRQLVWREFYYHILFHFPYVEHGPFKKQYSEIKWRNRKDWFEAWKNGLTGFPIVDAGMRQLKTTGWMHNRVRMIVASFLTKDLLIDYRWGEKWFMELLLDGDLAPNNGGWQWAASTGSDPQPCFRIFNPELQSLKFDPDGEYIKKYIPELRGLNSKDIHSPGSAVRPKSYPAPLVIHSEQKIEAIKLFKR